MALETFGSIIKEEQVKTVEHNVLPNTFVLENLGSYPGYYGADLPVHRDVDSIFLVMTQKESTEKILRLSHDIKKKSKINFEGTPASLYIQNHNYDAIRLRYLKGYDHITEIQEHYRDAGIVFEKLKKVEEIAIITIKKVFKIDYVTDKILKDDEKGMYYLKIDEQLTWSHFKKVTYQLRNNVKISAFDAALAVIYGADILDLVRIYSTTLTTAELELLHDKYEELIAKSMQ
jgi:hypothetical protein